MKGPLGMAETPRLLIIAGSDSGGGAGLQADIKTATALGVYAMTAVTAVTAQNTLGVAAAQALAPDLVAAQIRAVMGDLGADAIKTGVLANAALADAAASALANYAAIPRVIDPVMVATSGDRLLDADAVEVYRQRLIPGGVITPNAPEAAALTGMEIARAADLERAGRALLDMGASAALMKGGHVPGDPVVDLLVSPGGVQRFEHPRLGGREFHGTGCTLASALASGLAKGLPLGDAAAAAHAYLGEAMRAAPEIGSGARPLNHACLWRKMHDTPDALSD